MRRLRAWAPAAVWMGVIFAMSAMPGDVSGGQSGMIVQAAMKLASRLFGPQAAARISPDMLHLIVRKGAHMAEYAVLFCCFYRALRFEGAKRPGMIALLMCAGYAASDEIHQGFVAGRGPSSADVCIDTLGAAIAWALTRLYKKTKKETER
ncbi:MAG: VanZ family protein [Clostridia bacterium]|nr:VanZ family protein [Clostridia bacterium]